MSTAPTGTASASAAVAVVAFMVWSVGELEGLDLGEESLHLRLHCGIGLIGRCECGSMFCGCGSALVFVNLEARHDMVHNGVGVVEDEFINHTSCSSEFKVSLAEVMFEIVPHFVCLVCALPRSDVIFEDLLSV